jgi:rhamnogalacturonyl hydrolase YesR
MSFSQIFKVTLLVTLLLPVLSKSQNSNNLKALNNFPVEANPISIGTRLTERFIQRPHSHYGSWHSEEEKKKADLFNYPLKQIVYPDVCTWYGALTFSKASGQTRLVELLIKRAEKVLGEESYLVPVANHVDNNVFGAVPLEVYIQNKDNRFLSLGLYIANGQFKTLNPQEYSILKEDEKSWYNSGLSWQTRMWIDDMYMITILQAQAFRATGDIKYINNAAKEMVAYLDELQKPNGLFYHAENIPIYWGRGNGWMAAGMTELLTILPKEHANRERIMNGYQKMMNTLLKLQDSAGMWHQIVDDTKAWQETSCTGMFAFAFISGIKNGWLEPTLFAPAARKAWIALCNHINKDGDVTDICVSTSKKNDYQYYLDRERKVGDLHGQAPLLWCATALLR